MSFDTTTLQMHPLLVDERTIGIGPPPGTRWWRRLTEVGRSTPTQRESPPTCWWLTCTAVVPRTPLAACRQYGVCVTSCIPMTRANNTSRRAPLRRERRS